MRIDVYLYQNGYVKSRQKAKGLIESGNVKIDNKIVSKSSLEVDIDKEHVVEITDDCKFVSRGGLKLEAILNFASIDVKNKLCIDIGASTGGFTDCLLKNGAKRVFSVDTGTNQLDLSLRNNERVVSIENYNARSIDFSLTNTLVDIITLDVSFISQTLIMPSALKLINDDGMYISLIKPQFEVGRSNIGKGGIVKNKKAILEAISNINMCAKKFSFVCTSFIKSPILGGDGNTEFLAVFSKRGTEISENHIKNIVMN